MIRPFKPQETDIDQVDGDDTEVFEKMEISCNEESFTYDCCEMKDTETVDLSDSGKMINSKPPTPPLHRFPSWVSELDIIK